MSDNELTADELRRVNTLREGGELLDALLLKNFAKEYNIVILVCPKGEKNVSMVSKIESMEALNGMLTVGLINACDELHEFGSGTLQ